MGHTKVHLLHEPWVSINCLFHLMVFRFHFFLELENNPFLKSIENPNDNLASVRLS
jgi:hypothetical protein